MNFEELRPLMVNILIFLYNERNREQRYISMIRKKTNSTGSWISVNLKILRGQGLIEEDNSFEHTKYKKLFKLTKKGEEVVSSIMKLKEKLGEK